ncbi:hypothetical protein PsorP6_005893 [Peronosclerospora sorghi]|uniref:Uncharacterized protein n=1 Tax=Peronosclerospora sorghi TaxID=230839 RepID=A0ACC0W559_9STRA|nr:hypothetical protein PsorP6_005893 [Peronosclerospora sorghi]
MRSYRKMFVENITPQSKSTRTSVVQRGRCRIETHCHLAIVLAEALVNAVANGETLQLWSYC